MMMTAWVRRLVALCVVACAAAVSVSRRQALRIAAAPAAVASGASPLVASAKRYQSGKNPDGVKDKNDNTGTKRDGGYLQCLAGCSSRCTQASPGQREKTRGECLNFCRDECCSTYEQCTYNIPGT